MLICKGFYPQNILVIRYVREGTIEETVGRTRILTAKVLEYATAVYSLKHRDRDTNNNLKLYLPRAYLHPSLPLTLLLDRHGCVVLKLVERPLEHVLRIDLLHSQQVQHHVVCQVERRVQRIRLALGQKKREMKCASLLTFQLYIFFIFVRNS